MSHLFGKSDVCCHLDRNSYVASQTQTRGVTGITEQSASARGIPKAIQNLCPLLIGDTTSIYHTDLSCP